MKNYHYIIAGLPDIFFNGDNKTILYEPFREAIYENCDNKDKKLIEWFEFGCNEDNLNSHFYNASFKGKNTFIRAYYTLDLEIRNKKVDFISKAQNDKEMEKYQINPIHYNPLYLSQDDDDTLNQIFGNENILEKEKMLDKFKWEFISSFSPYGEFNMNRILEFLAKVKLIDRWNKLDKRTGEELFKKFVDEIQGTYKVKDINK